MRFPGGLRDETGQAATEYALVGMLLGIFTALATQVDTIANQVASTVNQILRLAQALGL